MKDFEHLKSVWLEQPKDQPLAVEEVLKQIKKEMVTVTGKLFWSIVALTTAFVSMLIILVFFAFQSWLTYIGIIIMLITLLIYSVLLIRDYRLIYREDFMLSTSEYLAHLKVYQTKRAQLYGWSYYLYLLLLSLGLGLYLAEILQSASPYFKIFTYSLTIIWFLICTFYLKQKIVKNEQEKINLMIDRLHSLQHQFA
ncbi:MAG: hypothetical protein ACOH2A_11890 [Sphingobacteriaceae bacterium]